MSEVQIEEEALLEKIPIYKSHKVVRAFKIRRIDPDTAWREEDRENDGSASLVPEDRAKPAIKVDHKYMQKHDPQVGGYLVVYEDGYKSFSPAEAFEGGYTRIDESLPCGDKPDFQLALRHLCNEYCMENTSDTPDYILAQFLDGCLEVFDVAVARRDKSREG